MEKSVRLPGYDYSKLGFYFVIICTKNRKHIFGEIKNQIMCLSISGKFVYALQQIRDDIYLDEFIVMPNYVHGIIILDKNVSGNDYGISKNEIDTVGIARG